MAAEQSNPPGGLLAIDWGTSSARAYRLAADGAVLDERAGPLGIQQVQDGRFAAALDALLGDWKDDPAPRLACGMIGSRQGWVEAPYVATPAGLDRLAHGLVEVPSARLHIVPGISTRDADGIPDVMRGEETQLLGALGPDAPGALVVLPGTHSKWAHVTAGRVEDFMTFMTGELYAVLLEHSILGRLAQRAAGAGATPHDAQTLPDAFGRGVTRGLSSGALAHDVFGARTLALHGELAPDEVEHWLSGLLIGREIADALNWAQARGIARMAVNVVGSAVLRTRYVAALHMAGREVAVADPHAAALGLWRIACAARLVERQRR